MFIDDQNKSQEFDLLVVGGGASGLLAAISAVHDGDFSGTIAIIEKESIALRKLLASGNGRCNLANLSEVEGHYHGVQTAFIDGALRRMPATELLSYFERLGLMTLVDHASRVYPRSMQSKSVSLILLQALESLNIPLFTGLEVVSIEKTSDTFRVVLSDQSVMKARAVIVAAGSPASPNLGGSPSGLSLLRSLGHTIREPMPALAPLKIKQHRLLRLAEGVRFRGSAYFESFSGECSPTVEGEFLITSYGLSGIASMELARFVSEAECRMKQKKAETDEIVGKVIIDFLPEVSTAALRAHLEMVLCSHAPGTTTRAEPFDPRRLRVEPTKSHEKTGAISDRIRTIIAGLVPEKIGQSIVSPSNTNNDRPSHDMTDLINALKGYALEVEGTRGFEFAQVAVGGALTKEFDSVTMMSHINPGLFACGEILDIDGDTGGYNLMWAFSSGYQAGISVVDYLSKR